MRMKLVTPLIVGLSWATAVPAAPVFVNGLAIPGNTEDLSGDASAIDRRMGFFSDLYYDPNRNEWWALSDRGPGGGTLSYETRMNRFTLDVDFNTGAISNFQIVQTIKFRSGVALNGLAPSPTNILGNAFDPEGLVVHPKNGHFLVSDEYGPSLYEFDRNGNLIRAFNIPANVIPRNAANIPNYASDLGNVAGKRANRGFEGLAISPDGKYVFAILQSAMLDEGGSTGKVNRIVKFDYATGNAVAQYAYEMKRSGQGQGVSALVALNDHEFLVLERNNRGIGVGATFATADKEVYKIDISGATDVSAIDLDSSVVYAKVSKSSPWLDLDEVTIDLDGDGDAEGSGKTLEKWEGLTIGPRLAGGSYLLLVGTDNDYSVTQDDSGTQFDVWVNFNDPNPNATTIQCPLGSTVGCTGELTAAYHLLPGVLYAYQVPATDLVGYRAPVPEPGTTSMLLAGLGLLSSMTRRRCS